MGLSLEEGETQEHPPKKKKKNNFADPPLQKLFM